MWVLRHAKAARQGPDDHSRSLTARGRRQAAEIGGYLAGASPSGARRPELVLCSSARRAVETAELVLAQLEAGVELVVDRRLYDGGADDVIEVVRELGGDAPSVMVVGHNPTVHELALLLVNRQDVKGRVRLEGGFPTAALAVLSVTTPSWDRLSSATGTLLELRTPAS